VVGVLATAVGKMNNRPFKYNVLPSPKEREDAKGRWERMHLDNLPNTCGKDANHFNVGY
jgi:hypothetical protein